MRRASNWWDRERAGLVVVLVLGAGGVMDDPWPCDWLSCCVCFTGHGVVDLVFLPITGAMLVLVEGLRGNVVYIRGGISTMASVLCRLERRKSDKKRVRRGGRVLRGWCAGERSWVSCCMPSKKPCGTRPAWLEIGGRRVASMSFSDF